MTKRILAVLLLFPVYCIAFSQNVNRVKEPAIMREFYRQEIIIPDIPGYVTLKGDFHMHTVFSDGSVWPSIRVQEAYYEGLDAIAITEHIEHRPNIAYLTGDHNTAYEIAEPEAERLNMLLVKSSEISRSMPPGHLNALFLEDANLLEKEDFMDAIEEANRQGAFLFWAHPGWDAQQPDTTMWWPVHEDLVNRGWLHGIEVFNWDEWYPVAFDWCNEKELAYLGNSDIHIVASHRFDLEKYHRPMTLVFAEERSVKSLREAMFARRTVAFFLNSLAGPENLLRQLFNESVTIDKPFREDDKGIASVILRNPTDLTFILESEKPQYNSPGKITIRPRSSVIINCNVSEGVATLLYNITNLHTGTNRTLQVELMITKD